MIKRLMIVVLVAGSAFAQTNDDVGDNKAATNAFVHPTGVAVDLSGNVYIADSRNHRIRKVDAATKVITTVAGTGSPGLSGEGLAATQAMLNEPERIAIDGFGNLYIADTKNHCIRKVAGDSGVITRIAGTGVAGYSGDYAQAVYASLNTPRGVAVDSNGNVFIADTGNERIRKIDSSGVITTVAGTGFRGFSGDGFTGDGLPAVNSALNVPTDVAVAWNGDLFIADSLNNRIRKVNAGTGLMTTIAGETEKLDGPSGVDVDDRGNVFIAETGASRIRVAATTGGRLTTIVGTETGFGGDGSKGIDAKLALPRDIIVSGLTRELYIADTNNLRVRKVTTQGVISTIAGNGALPGESPRESAELLGGMNPFLSRVGYFLFLVATVAGAIFAGWRVRRKWKDECAHVRAAIFKQTRRKTTEGILGIVPAIGFTEDQPKAASPFWLCFLSDRIVSIRGATNEVDTLHLKDLASLELVEGAGDSPCLAVKTTGQRSPLDKILIRTDRVDDMVRVVNILVQQGIALRYRRIW